VVRRAVDEERLAWKVGSDVVEDGIDKAADMAKGMVPDEHDDKVDMAADKAKDMADKIDGEDD